MNSYNVILQCTITEKKKKTITIIDWAVSKSYENVRMRFIQISDSPNAKQSQIATRSCWFYREPSQLTRSKWMLDAAQK